MDKISAFLCFESFHEEFGGNVLFFNFEKRCAVLNHQVTEALNFNASGIIKHPWRRSNARKELKTVFLILHIKCKFYPNIGFSKLFRSTRCIIDILGTRSGPGFIMRYVLRYYILKYRKYKLWLPFVYSTIKIFPYTCIALSTSMLA